MTETENLPAPFRLKKLSDKHKQVAALLAQGLGRTEISKIVDVVPEYVTMLARQPLFAAYVREMTVFTDVRLQALFEGAVDVTAHIMKNGTEEGQLKAAAAVMKAIGKDGQNGQPNVSVKFVVQVPAKAATTKDWESAYKPRSPVVVDQE